MERAAIDASSVSPDLVGRSPGDWNRSACCYGGVASKQGRAGPPGGADDDAIVHFGYGYVAVKVCDVFRLERQESELAGLAKSLKLVGECERLGCLLIQEVQFGQNDYWDKNSGFAASGLVEGLLGRGAQSRGCGQVPEQSMGVRDVRLHATRP